MSQHLGSNGAEVNQPTASAVIADHSSINVDRPGAAANNEDEKETNMFP
jgi:hypothetical protein